MAASSAPPPRVVWAMRTVDAAAKMAAHDTMVSGLEAVADQRGPQRPARGGDIPGRLQLAVDPPRRDQGAGPIASSTPATASPSASRTGVIAAAGGTGHSQRRVGHVDQRRPRPILNPMSSRPRSKAAEAMRRWPVPGPQSGMGGALAGWLLPLFSW